MLEYLSVILPLLGFSFGQSGSDSSSASESGLPAWLRTSLGAIGAQGGNFAEPIIRAMISPQQNQGTSYDLHSDYLNYQRPGGVGGGSASGPGGAPGISMYHLPELTTSGLYAPQQTMYDQGFKTAVSQVLSSQSGDYARRGLNNPEHIDALAGSAAQRVAPQFWQQAAPMAGQNILNRTQVPTTLSNQSLATMIDYIRTILSGGSTGSTGTAQSSSSAFNFGVNSPSEGSKAAALF